MYVDSTTNANLIFRFLEDANDKIMYEHFATVNCDF